jgi:hypothetical protein
MRCGDHGLPGQPVWNATADTFHRPDGSRKNLASSTEFRTRLNDVAYTSDPRVFSRLDRFESRCRNPFISRHDSHQIFPIDG